MKTRKYVMTVDLNSDAFDEINPTEHCLAVMTAVDQTPEVSLIQVDEKTARCLRKTGATLKRAKRGSYRDYETDRVIRIR